MLYWVAALGSEDLVCPYSGCGRSFEQPVIVTDYSKLPRETHYACPHCMLKLELLLEGGAKDNFGHVHLRAVEDERLEIGDKGKRMGEPVSSAVASRPSKACRHFLGYLRCLPLGANIPDECAVCPSIVKCYIKKE